MHCARAWGQDGPKKALGKGIAGRASYNDVVLLCEDFPVDLTLERCRQQVVGITVPDHIHLPNCEGHFKVKIDACIEFVSDEFQAGANVSLTLPTGKQV